MTQKLWYQLIIRGEHGRVHHITEAKPLELAQTTDEFGHLAGLGFLELFADLKPADSKFINIMDDLFLKVTCTAAQIH